MEIIDNGIRDHLSVIRIEKVVTHEKIDNSKIMAMDI
jgi:hypothetical protein